MTVLQLNAIDVDEGNNAQITYSAVGQIPQLGEQDLFVVSSTGAITTTTAASNILWPDHDMFSFTVRAEDNPLLPDESLHSMFHFKITKLYELIIDII